MKIGMYTEDEIFNYMTNCEGSMLGRSMYDAVFGKLHALITENEQLKQKEDIINKARKYISKHTQHDENGYVVECLYVEEAKELLEILDNKGE